MDKTGIGCATPPMAALGHRVFTHSRAWQDGVAACAVAESAPPVAHLGPETGRSRKDKAIVLLAALAMDGGMDGGSVALRTTPRAWLVRKASGVVIGF